VCRIPYLVYTNWKVTRSRVASYVVALATAAYGGFASREAIGAYLGSCSEREEEKER